MKNYNSSISNETDSFISQYRCITASESWRNYFKEVFSYRELFYFLVWRDLLVRYKQTALGISWALIRPFLIMIIFTGLFQKVAHFSSGNNPYFLFVLVSLVPWQFFCDSVLFGTSSLLVNEQLISKIYFPRILIPASYVFSSCLDCLITFFCFFVLLGIFSEIPIWYKCCFSILFFAWTIIFSLGITSFLAALIVRYRDVRYVVPFLMQMGLYISPIGFRSSYIPNSIRWIYFLNPMAGIIDGLRWCFLDDILPIEGIAISLLVTIFICIISGVYFRNVEKIVADII